MRRDRSIAATWFEDLYRADPDPWSFASSPYEAAKYAHTLEALPRPRYARALEVGCSIGVLTRQLAERCDLVLAIDVSSTALARAAIHLRAVPNVELRLTRLPDDPVEGLFDLIILSEVAYYLDRPDLRLLAARLNEALAAEGDVLLVHWTGPTDYPVSGDDAVAALAEDLGRHMEVLRAERSPEYRLDLWRRSGHAALSPSTLHDEGASSGDLGG